jgi:hypothetical protein
VTPDIGTIGKIMDDIQSYEYYTKFIFVSYKTVERVEQNFTQNTGEDSFSCKDGIQSVESTCGPTHNKSRNVVFIKPVLPIDELSHSAQFETNTQQTISISILIRSYSLLLAVLEPRPLQPDIRPNASPFHFQFVTTQQERNCCYRPFWSYFVSRELQ